MSGEIVNTEKAPNPVGAYPHARKVGNLLFLSGVGSRKAGTDKIPGIEFDENGNVTDHDAAIETETVIENVRLILEASGSSFDKIVDVQVFLTNMKRDFKAFNAVYKKHFEGIQATRTTIEVGSLPTPIHVEFKVIATI